MKPRTIIGLILMIGFGSLLFLNFGEQVSGYMNFSEAEQTGSKAHVVGTWVREMQSSYDPARNVFTFYMKDETGTIRRVQYANPKPASFEDAEKVVIEGYAEGDVFVAEHILLKCPSKYNDERALQNASDVSS